MLAASARLGVMLAVVCLQLAASDLRPQQTARLAGVVVTAAGSHAPVRRAIVTITATDQQSRGAVTDDQGRFAFAGLAPGRFTLTVSKAAYVPTTYGATPARRSGTPIELAAGDAITDLIVPIVRGAAMSGVVRDANGEPASGVRVMALPRNAVVRFTDVPELSTFTDDRGEYRLYGLAAGEYVIAVIPQSVQAIEIDVMTDALVDATLRQEQLRAGRAAPRTTAPARPSRPHAYVPIFYPGTASGADATWLTLAAGDDRTGLDVALSLVSVASIEGLILSVDGAPTAAGVSLTSSGPTIPTSVSGGAPPELALRPGADGRFRFNRVAPGHYALMARASGAGPSVVMEGPSGLMVSRGRGAGTVAQTPVTPGWARTEIDVTGDDVTGVVLHLQPMMGFAGRVVFAGEPPAPELLKQIRLALYPLNFGSPAQMDGVPQGPAPIVVSGTVKPDGTFEVRGLTPGLYYMRAGPSPVGGSTSLWLRSAMLDGRELLDAPIEIKALGDISDVVLTLSDRHTELSGMLQDGSGRPDTDDAVIVFPADRALWQPQSRRIRSMRPNPSGRFAFADLPPGDYVLATLTDASGTEWQKPESLAQIVSVGVKVTIGEGERKTQDLRAR